MGTAVAIGEEMVEAMAAGVTEEAMAAPGSTRAANKIVVRISPEIQIIVEIIENPVATAPQTELSAPSSWEILKLNLLELRPIWKKGTQET